MRCVCARVSQRFSTLLRLVPTHLPVCWGPYKQKAGGARRVVPTPCCSARQLAAAAGFGQWNIDFNQQYKPPAKGFSSAPIHHVCLLPRCWSEGDFSVIHEVEMFGVGFVSLRLSSYVKMSHKPKCRIHVDVFL